MSNSKDPQSYLLAAGGLSVIVAGITYCAVNWDSPPDWWPNRLQPWWNKKESEQKQTDQYVNQEDEVETTEPLVVKEEPVVLVKPAKQVEEVSDVNTVGLESVSEDKEVTESLVKPENVEVDVTKK